MTIPFEGTPNKPTQMMVYNCRYCGHTTDPEPAHARVNRCDNCRSWGLQYLSWDPETEAVDAAIIIRRWSLQRPLGYGIRGS
jgi:DNA-directed RNA polymerase subunit RPC12/RpoP